jgi:fatty-acyl-CoA synthase
MNPSATIRLTDLARSVVRMLPTTPQTLRGVKTLLHSRISIRNSLPAVLEQCAAQHPDNIAVIFEQQRWSYRAFNAWANRIAHVLAARGVKKGTVVALLMENHANGLALVAGIVKLGGIAAMLNPNQQGDVLAHSLNTVKASQLIVAGECLTQAQALSADLPRYWLQGYGDSVCPEGYQNMADLIDHAPSHNPSTTASVTLKDPAYYILTSGTTGLPKASVMTHSRWIKGMAGLGQMSLRLTPEDVLYCPLPLYHNNALTVSWGAAMGNASGLVIERKFSASRFWTRCRDTGATAFCYIGELCRYLLAQPEGPQDRDHGVRACIGNGLRPDLWHAFKNRFGIERVCEFYGASEGNLAFVNSFNLDQTAGFCPYSYAIVECDIEAAAPRFDGKGRLIKVKKGGVGLLVTQVTEAMPFDGYTDGKASQSKLIQEQNGDCWFNTGDLVRDQGFKHIQFVDRLGDTFRWKGENVATTEVEAAFNDVAGLEEAVVYGALVPHSDGRAGMAALRFAADFAGEFDGAALAQHLKARLPAYAVPLFLRVVKEIATTATFKNQKAALREQGANPAKVNEPLYYLAGAAYAPLTATVWAEVEAGRLRL